MLPEVFIDGGGHMWAPASLAADTGRGKDVLCVVRYVPARLPLFTDPRDYSLVDLPVFSPPKVRQKAPSAPPRLPQTHAPVPLLKPPFSFSSGGGGCGLEVSTFTTCLGSACQWRRWWWRRRRRACSCLVWSGVWVTTSTPPPAQTEGN
ncbi:hypothetical protein O3P69_006804 [Scylla paramamosain]|uniref:Uncharacterized protein n=1 Tax=Scylla paramamosain TaxID=85552 RepID=A0AAW0U2H9_SCYPA